ARELRSMVRQGDIKAEVGPMFKWTMDELTPERLVLSYSFAYYMQSTPQRASSFAAMIRRIESSHQIPAPLEIAPLFGFETPAARAELARRLLHAARPAAGNQVRRDDAPHRILEPAPRSGRKRAALRDRNRRGPRSRLDDLREGGELQVKGTPMTSIPLLLAA